MTDRDLKRLSKSDLLEIIYQQKKQELELRQKLEKAQKELSERRICMAETGSIAEASLKINKVFEAAQAAADSYLAEIHASNEDLEQIHMQKIARTDAECRRRLVEADAQIAAKWAEFERNILQYIQSRSELKNFFTAGSASSQTR